MRNEGEQYSGQLRVNARVYCFGPGEAEVFVIYPDRMMSAKERRERNEKRFLIEALMRTNGNQSQAAKNLDISPSSMSIKRKFYGI